MPRKSPVFVGVEIIRSAGRLRQAFVYAALDTDRELLAIGHGDRDEILAYLGGQGSAHVAINAPRQLKHSNTTSTDASTPPNTKRNPFKYINLIFFMSVIALSPIHYVYHSNPCLNNILVYLSCQISGG